MDRAAVCGFTCAASLCGGRLELGSGLMSSRWFAILSRLERAGRPRQDGQYGHGSLVECKACGRGGRGAEVSCARGWGWGLRGPSP
eukprot:scaffold8214_cov121-Isochrysis_galbana.AAC.15